MRCSNLIWHPLVTVLSTLSHTIGWNYQLLALIGLDVPIYSACHWFIYTFKYDWLKLSAPCTDWLRDVPKYSACHCFIYTFKYDWLNYQLLTLIGQDVPKYSNMILGVRSIPHICKCSYICFSLAHHFLRLHSWWLLSWKGFTKPCLTAIYLLLSQVVSNYNHQIMRH